MSERGTILHPELRHHARELASQGQLAAAIDAIRQSYEDGPLPAAERLTIARYRYWLQDFDAAEAEVSALLETHPELPGVAATAAELERNKGNIDRARSLLCEAADRQPEDASIILARVDLGGPLDASVISKAEAIASSSDTPIDGRRMMSFALARYYDANGDFDSAWARVTAANALYGDVTPYDRSRHERELQNAVAIFNASESASPRGGITPLYLIGPPRSGGTLLQTVLGAAPEVATVGERGALLPYLFELSRVPAASGIEAFSEQRDALRDADIAGLKALIGEANWFIDKTPHHLHVAGLVTRIHPRARLIDVHRDPVEVALSILFHDFPQAFDYSRNTGDIVDYLLFRNRALECWRNAGVEIIDYDHDAFVQAPELVGARLFKTLELDWKDQYLESSNRSAIVQTFSAAQVRSPVAASQRRRSRDYARFVGDTIARLAGE